MNLDTFTHFHYFCFGRYVQLTFCNHSIWISAFELWISTPHNIYVSIFCYNNKRINNKLQIENFVTIFHMRLFISLSCGCVMNTATDARCNTIWTSQRQKKIPINNEFIEANGREFQLFISEQMHDILTATPLHVFNMLLISYHCKSLNLRTVFWVLWSASKISNKIQKIHKYKIFDQLPFIYKYINLFNETTTW